jgi:hypothetical protein
MKKKRVTQKGPDYTKIAKIYKALAESGDWMHIAGIAQKTGLNQVTVRYYLDTHMKKFIDETRIAPTIKLRLVKLKEGITLQDIIKRIEILKDIHQKPEPTIAEAFAEK